MRMVGRVLGGVVLMVLLLTAGHATIRFVSSTSEYPTIQSALDACSDGDIVLVDNGTCYENIIWPDVQGIQLLAEAGPYYNRIDGDTVGYVIQITTGVDSTTVISGFNIRNGYAASGAGIYCVNSSPTISNNLINYNESTDSAGGGGGIYCSNSSPVITGNDFAFNDAAASGGAIFCENNSFPTIADNRFYANGALAGGAIAMDGSSPLISNNTFSTNSADSIGGGIFGRNGSSPTITENVMYNNSSLSFSYSSGGAILIDSNCVPTITENTIHNNRADSAIGGVGCFDGVITDNDITDNRANYAGGVGIGPRGSVTVTGNTITGNYVNQGGGGIICGAYSSSLIRDNVISDNWGQYSGGGIICDTGSTPIIRKNVITDNGSSSIVGEGAGIRCSDTAAPLIDSCIITNNDGDAIWCADGAVPSIHHNEIENNADDGVRNTDNSVTIDATNNWWGAPSGPGGAGPGSGDEVSGNVDYDPWRTKSTIDSISPSTPYVYNAKSGDHADLSWNAISTDTLGGTETMDHYVVYRSSSPSFVPGHSDSIGAVVHPETTFTDSNALLAGSDYYYLVKAVDWKKNMSTKSNMAYVFRSNVNENPSTTDKNWISLPWHNDYVTVSDLTADLSPSGDPLVKVTNLRDDQLFESWLWDDLFMEWSGTNFNITSGCGYEMVTVQDTFLLLVGSNDPAGAVPLNENPGTTDKNWVSVPYNATYTTVSDITDEYSPAGDPLIKVTNLRDDQLFESWLWDDLFMEWSGTNFAITTGRAYEMVAVNDTSWNPTEYSNASKAHVDWHTAATHTIEMKVGSSSEATRAPLWQMADDRWQIAKNQEPRAKNQGQIVDGESINTNGRESQDADSHLPGIEHSVESVEKNVNGELRIADQSQKSKVQSPEDAQILTPRMSHVVRAHVVLNGTENLIFTAYRPGNPHDVLTEQQIGSGVAYKDGIGALWFDVGNFQRPWQDGEELIVIIEAVEQGKGYYSVINCVLDARIDIQELATIELMSIREANDYVIGYSEYRNGVRLNDEILAVSAAAGDIVVRPVMRGGHETVYGSSGVQTEHHEVSVAYAFDITPNPFGRQTNITYTVPQRSMVELTVYDATGREVVRLASGQRDPGYYSTVWRGSDAHGRLVAAGVYFVQYTAGPYTAREKLLLIR